MKVSHVRRTAGTCPRHCPSSPAGPRREPDLADLCATRRQSRIAASRKYSAGASLRSVGRAAPVSAGVATARSSPFSVRHSEQIQQGCARPCSPAGPQSWRRQASWRGSKETGAKAGQKGTAVSHHRRVRVPGSHAHLRPGDHLRVIGCPACCPESAARPGTAAQWPASGGRGDYAALAATRAPGHEPHDDEYGHRDQSDDDKRLERSHDPARSRDGKPDGENRAEDCPDDPAHVPSMPPDLCRW